MSKTNLHFNKEKVSSYRSNYRSSSISYFMKSLLSVIVMGKSPVGSVSYYRIKKTSK
ncbi:MAG TPA: hypothetical protein VKT28_00125 [Puia sp.]|nr:hypothetical protein [Puia sp.]